ncbi:cell division protein FtsZ [Hydrogenophaga sp. YM1]|uniref:cell division protein ZipA C-terminal FtsZ-binding domain-containing protein n=1 Tax=Hydrogenophaga sp. YM1 TaxID=2806262 RepID=UPI0019568D7F|nr:cell division protein ZipA C-terminal FtsZ-binding domain-containing protein [Hydrogenophaga sp. YM1]QRR32577.1 cell division protein FtsZ [Hydrogenophaga sp. YM1]
MSSLQIGLVIVGGLVLAAVVAYNAWITRQSAPRTARERLTPGEALEPALGPQGDPLAERREPGFGDVAPDGEGDAVVAESPREGLDGEAAGPVGGDEGPIEPTLAPLPERRPGPALDALIDVIAPLALEHEVSGEAVLAALPATRRVGSKPFAVEGLNAQSGEWEVARPHQRYRALQAGVQLANRAGPLNDIEFSEFVVKAQAFADAVGASPDFPDMRAEVARARELDAFASGHDAQLGFTLRARRAAWSPGYVSQHAGRLGFVAGTLPGRMVLPASQPGQPPLLALAYDSQAAMADDPEQSALREITLSLEVTHVARGELPFARLRQAAQALAEAMDGVVTDDTGAPLPAEAMDQIGLDLEGLYDALDERDLAAGSPQARRLFS